MHLKPGTLEWCCKPFAELTAIELYEILQLRSRIFVVEQNCVYQDCDGKDQVAWHLIAKEKGNIVAYTRILPPGISYPHHASIGRVVVDISKRGTGIGKLLMQESINQVYHLYGQLPISIGAQYHLQKFYAEFGFEPVGDPYDEDGILHITMSKGVGSQ